MTDEPQPPEDATTTASGEPPEDTGEPSSAPRPIEIGGPVDDLQRGALVGRFVVLRRLSKGPWSVVYAAFDPKLDRKIALTLLPVDHEDHDEAKAQCAQLIREVLAASKVDHANVVAVHDVGVFATGVYVAAEYVGGINLRHWMEARDEPFPWHEVLRVFVEAGRGLAAAHAAGVTHRDFKPDNIILGRGGGICVIDFGLAPVIEDETEDEATAQLRSALPETFSSLSSGADPTMAAGLRGTPAYMAPEQHAARRGDAKSDQFAFCVAFYEVLYGERPFKGQRRATLALEALAHRVRPAPAGSDVPEWLRALLVRGLSPRRKDRFPSLEALLSELDHDPTARRRRWWWGMAAVGAVGVLGGGVAYLLHLERHQCDADAALLEGVWDSASQAAMQASFIESGRPHAEESWDETRNAVDAWVDQWLDYRQLACRATKEWGSASAELQARREGCLESRLHELGAFTRVYAHATAPMIDHATAFAGDLEPPSTCARETALEEADDLATFASPGAGEFAAEAVEIRAELLTGRLELAHAHANELARRVSDTAPVTISIAAAVLRADALVALGEPAQARELLHAAAARASAAGLRRPLASIWLALLSAPSAGSQDSTPWLGHARALVAELGDPRLQTQLAIIEGDRAQAAGRDREALGSFHRAIELAEADELAPARRISPALLRLAGLAARRREWTSAARYLDRALRAQQARLGARHPTLIATYRAQADVALAQDRFDDAVSLLDRALSITVANRPGHEDREARLRVSMGEIELSRGQPRAGTAQFDLALQALEQAPHASTLVQALRGKASGLLALGQPEAAGTTVELALEANRDDTTRSRGLGMLIATVATAMWDVPEARPRALQLMRRARDSLPSPGRGSGEGAQTIERWLAAHVPEAGAE